MQRSDQLHARSGGPAHSHTHRVFLDDRSLTGSGTADRDRPVFVRNQDRPGADELHRGDSRSIECSTGGFHLQYNQLDSKRTQHCRFAAIQRVRESVRIDACVGLKLHGGHRLHPNCKRSCNRNVDSQFIRFPHRSNSCTCWHRRCCGFPSDSTCVSDVRNYGHRRKEHSSNREVTNNGPVPLTSLYLFTSAGFEVASTNCEASVDPGASCNALIVFAPTKTGQQRGDLTVSSSSLAANSTVSLSGMGFDFTVSSSGPSSQTVPSGKTGIYMLSLTPLGGLSGTFTFSCTGLPANSSCSFNPPSELVAGDATGTVAVQIATGMSSSSATNGGSLGRMLHLLPLACTLFALRFARRRRRKWILMVMLTAGLIGIASCAGAGGGNGGAPPLGPTGDVTPSGTYSVMVTASANGISHKTTLTLTVD